jgi:hypothetical protein
VTILDELIAEAEALDARVQEYLDEAPSAKIEHNARYLQYLLRSLKEVRGDPVITMKELTRQVTIHQPPKVRARLTALEQHEVNMAHSLFEQGAIDEDTPEAFREWQKKRRAEMPGAPGTFSRGPINGNG